MNERNRLFSRALASLHPVTWPEPFGLTLIEAMACGCPVVAFDQGSIPEVVAHGVSGYVVHTIEEMADATVSIDKINRSACRTYALSHFSEEQMTDGYEKIYENILTAAANVHTRMPFHSNGDKGMRIVRTSLTRLYMQG